jgi:hypothetical protein
VSPLQQLRKDCRRMMNCYETILERRREADSLRERIRTNLRVHLPFVARVTDAFDFANNEELLAAEAEMLADHIHRLEEEQQKGETHAKAG